MQRSKKKRAAKPGRKRPAVRLPVKADPGEDALKQEIAKLSDANKRAIDTTIARIKTNPTAPDMKIREVGNNLVEFGGEPVTRRLRLLGVFGTADERVSTALFMQLLNATKRSGSLDPAAAQQALAIVQGLAHATRWRPCLPRRWCASTW